MQSLVSIDQQIYLIFNVTLAMILSGIIGINRERKDKSAGLRTHMLTGTGACIFTILSLYAFPNADTSRVASNVVTGIGFLCGGVIVQRKNETYDLTTAAGLWATAAVGMAIGAGVWLLAIYSTLAFWFILELVKRMKPILSDDSDDEKVITVKASKKSKSKSKAIATDTAKIPDMASS
jgi:putative Mg2+ transporter-C (MgtC) family protein